MHQTTPHTSSIYYTLLVSFNENPFPVSYYYYNYNNYYCYCYYFYLHTQSLSNQPIYLEITPGQNMSPEGLPKKKLQQLLVSDFLQAGCPSCHTTNSVKAMTVNTLPINVYTSWCELHLYTVTLGGERCLAKPIWHREIHTSEEK